jgi:hypothetical protein
VVLNKISFSRKRVNDDKVTPHPREVVFKMVPPERNPSTRPNRRESGPPTSNLNRRLVRVVAAISQSELGPPSNRGSYIIFCRLDLADGRYVSSNVLAKKSMKVKTPMD